MEARGVVSMELTVGSKSLTMRSSSSRCKVTIVLFLVMIGFAPIVVSFHFDPILDSVDPQRY
jgi:hypothetical protein